MFLEAYDIDLCLKIEFQESRKNLENRHFLTKKQAYSLRFFQFLAQKFFFVKSTFSYIELSQESTEHVFRVPKKLMKPGKLLYSRLFEVVFLISIPNIVKSRSRVTV